MNSLNKTSGSAQGRVRGGSDVKSSCSRSQLPTKQEVGREEHLHIYIFPSVLSPPWASRSQRALMMDGLAIS